MSSVWRRLATSLLLSALLLGGAAASTVQYVYDALGRLVAAVDPTGQTTIYTYDAAGNLLSVSNNASTQVAVVGFTPASGKTGDSITIFGSGFIPTPAQNNVSFNGTAAAVTGATATSLVATVPGGATSGPISVSNANGSASSSGAFTVLVAPTITAINPGVVGPGATRVEVSGTDLAYTTAVTFTQAGITALVLPGATNGVLPIRVTVGQSVPAGSYGFSVVNAAGSTASGSVQLAVTITPSGPAMSVSRTVSVFQPHPPNAPPEAGASQAVSPVTSVFMPFAPQSPPEIGSSQFVSSPTSVFMPLAVQSPPEIGSSQSISPATSVFLPTSSPMPPPSGDSMGVSPTTSVSMP